MEPDQAIYRELGSNIRKARETARMKQETLAERVGMTRTSITNIEKGNQRLLVHTLFAIAHALNVPTASLLPSTGAEPRGQLDVQRRLESEPAVARAWVLRVLDPSREEENNDAVRQEETDPKDR